MGSAPSETELDLLVELRDRVADLELDEEYLQPKNLVRFLRARECNLSKSEEMIRKSQLTEGVVLWSLMQDKMLENVEWLEAYDVKNLISFEPLPGWETGLAAPITGFDNKGGPIVHGPIGSWDPALVTGLMEEYIRWFIKLFETVWAVIQSNSKGKDAMDQFSIIIDLKGLGWKHYTNYAFLYGTLTAIRFFESNYPESLRVAYMVNAPSMFGMFWKLIKPLVSSATHEKLHFLSADTSTWKDAMSPFINEDQIFESYGGTLPDDFKLTLHEIKGGNLSLSKNGNTNEIRENTSFSKSKIPTK